MQTIKLYDKDAYISNFKATVLSCDKIDDYYQVILDQTAFFPEGGGQACDTGTIEDTQVFDVQITDGVIKHKTTAPINIGVALCKVDWDKRYRRMQNHSGEHILSGIAHKLYGCTNVGFHLGNEMTVDFDIELTNEQLLKIETLANEAVYKNVKITAEYPSPEDLSTLDYRSKLELTEDVRIVTIDDYDICACCAPHVKQSGEIGIIKILSSMRHRGGIRLTVICGADAFEDYRIKANNLHEIAVALCAKQNEELDAFKRLYNEISELKQKNAALSKELTSFKIKEAQPIDGLILYFEDDTDMAALRSIALESAKCHNGISAAFSGIDGNYKYAVSSLTESVSEIAAELNSTFSGRGGGSTELVQGSVSATKSGLEEYFKARC